VIIEIHVEPVAHPDQVVFLFWGWIASEYEVEDVARTKTMILQTFGQTLVQGFAGKVTLGSADLVEINGIAICPNVGWSGRSSTGANHHAVEHYYG